VCLNCLESNIYKSYGQKGTEYQKKSLYLLYESKMHILKEKDNRYKLNFTLKNRENLEGDSYIFFYDNYHNFKRLNLDKIKQKINIDTVQISPLKKLSKIPPCELHNMFYDYNQIFLVKKEKENFYIFPLIYYATTRWEIVK
jgi:hypothetical protein